MRVDPEAVLRRSRELIREHGGALPEDVLAAALRPATRLITRLVADDELPLGASRFGGRPDLPPQVAWPRRDGAGAPLSFLAQLDLASVPDPTGLLPAAGWLLFFYDAVEQPWGFDPRHRGAARVLHVDDERASLRRTDPPPDLAREAIFAPAAVVTELAGTLPQLEVDLGFALAPGDLEAYHALLQEHFFGPAHGRWHRLLGWPIQIQNDMRLECQLASHGIDCGAGPYGHDDARELEAGAGDWMLLLQVDSEEEGPGWMWGDAGCVYFWIRRQDLVARRFEDVWAILQCS